MKKLMKKLPFVHCGLCKSCKRCNFEGTFNDKAMVKCCDVNGVSFKTIIPFILWKLQWCKLYKEM